MKRKSLFVLISAILFLLVISILVYFLVIKNKNTNKNENTDTNKNGTEETNINSYPWGQNVLAEYDFSSGAGSWYEHIWYKATSANGEVSYQDDGVHFKSLVGNTRSGIMIDINKDVSTYKSIILTTTVTAKAQSLSGTGWQAREAPVAIAVAYKDVNGVDHKSLSEDPSSSQNMFWRGFYYLNPTDSNSKTTNGVKVVQNTPYEFSYDLTKISPKPSYIYFVGLEGAGWAPREGIVKNIKILGSW